MEDELQHTIDELRAQLTQQLLRVAELEGGMNQNRADEFPPTEEEEENNFEEGARALPPAHCKVFNASKIPDAIKFITPYHGEAKLLAGWIQSVEEKIKFAELACPTERDRMIARPLWSSIIRDKILGEANNVLIINQVSTNWEDMKEALLCHLGDKRDLQSLVTNILHLDQGNKTITCFYNECRELLTDISAKINLSKMDGSCAQQLITNYENMIMNAFIDGLRGNMLSALTRNSFPSTLATAYHNALEQYNGFQRKEEKLSKGMMRSSQPTFRHKLPPQQQHQYYPNPNYTNNTNKPSTPTYNNPPQNVPYTARFQANTPQPPYVKPGPTHFKKQNFQTRPYFNSPSSKEQHVNCHEDYPEQINPQYEDYEGGPSHFENTISEEMEELNFRFTREPPADP